MGAFAGRFARLFRRPVMPSPTPLLVVAAAVAFPFLCGAQPRPAAAFTPRLLAGVGGTVGAYQLPAGGAARVVSPMPATGLQFAPRFAVQASTAYGQETFRVHNTGFIGPSGRVVHQLVDGTNRRRTVPVAGLVRYTLTKRGDQRVQADMLAGVTWVHSSLRSQGTVRDSAGRGASAYDYVTFGTSTYLSGGAGVRYRLTSRFEGLAEWVFNRLVDAHPAVPVRLSATFALGVRYRFGREGRAR